MIHKNLETEIIRPPKNTAQRIRLFLDRVDKDFEIPLSSRVNIEIYSKKLSDFSVNIFLKLEKEDIAHASIYESSDHHQAFISSIAVLRAYSGYKIGSFLLSKIEEYFTIHGFEILKLEADCQSKALFHFYTSNEFILSQENNKCFYIKKIGFRA
jgi:ribosomal protein S18 acetylase RimI-like enzyme